MTGKNSFFFLHFVSFISAHFIFFLFFFIVGSCKFPVKNLYYLPKKNLPAHFEQLLFNDSSDFKKIGDQIEALQISEPVVQTASL